MFKKKGGLAFKPKIPSARPRPVALSTPAPVTKLTENEAAKEVTPETTTQDPSVNPVSPNVANEDVPPESETAAPQPPRQISEPAPVATPNPPKHDASTTNVETRPEPASEENNVIPRVSESAIPANATDEVPTRRDGRPATEKPKSRTDPKDHGSRNAHSTVTPPQSLAEESTSKPASAPAPVPAVANPTPAPTPATANTPQEATTDEPESVGQGKAGTTTRKRQKKPADAKQTRPRKRKSSAQEEDGQPKKARTARSLTPEDAESQVVDLQNLRMADLTKDLHIGKKFSRHDELRDRERQSRLKARLSKEGDQPAEEAEVGAVTPAGGQATSGPSNAAVASSAPAPAPAPTVPGSGPQFRIVDGQIVLDQNSLVMDRHARAEAARAGEDMETIEENDFTRLITSSSFMTTSKLKGPNVWTDPETAIFYRGLRMFGTDFEMISKMFPSKQRRNIKLKFNREERHNPRRIDAALIGEKTIKIDIEEYKSFTNAEYESVESIEAEQRKAKDAFEAERKRVVDEQAEIMRKKRDELFADDENVDNDAAGKKKKKGGKKKGKEPVSYGMNGEPIATT